MNNDEKALVISLIFLSLWAYGMHTFQDVETTLPFIGDVAFSDYGRYILMSGLSLTFILFLLIRRERKRDETGQQFGG